ncbi:ribokinase-like domain-containing protein [Glycocaulis alkaliphilus]|uniref:Ribokinase-like domain-containing protein n=1 Tax=Glycocaulis alkaliphilus TaxID=1434191 RepID=A0A3T0E5Y8_9PROT|nr:adenosine kinase [Glycocaulis alkaliphilus]AZU02743.1 ribokinase-like domain-containing protein [Glycocaulis alkaliphilus]GGB79344.1 adenosine kinase [Glycocaulis alkaliphilus]
MATPSFDIIGVGNAIVDVIATADDAFLGQHGIEKGAMTLIDEDRAKAIYAAMGPGQEVSGGSAANTLAGVASLGGRGAYIGKVADDQLGEIFAHDLRATGVDYSTAPLTGGPATARCLILVTPDAQRSMNTFLGASTLFSGEDVDAARIADAHITYLEGYLFDRDEAKAAFVAAAEIARKAGRKVALTLSDPFCVDRHRASFRQLIAGHVDVVFANEAELKSLYQLDDFDAALAQLRTQTRIAAITRSEKGAVIICGEESVAVPADPVERLVDTTGAGDLFAAGFLLGLARSADLETCGRLGVLAAAEVISHVGARPLVSLAGLAARRGITIPAAA